MYPVVTVEHGHQINVTPHTTHCERTGIHLICDKPRVNGISCANGRTNDSPPRCVLCNVKCQFIACEERLHNSSAVTRGLHALRHTHWTHPASLPHRVPRHALESCSGLHPFVQWLLVIRPVAARMCLQLIG